MHVTYICVVSYPNLPESWGMRSADRRKVIVIDRITNEEVRRSAGIERELASIADQRVLR